MLARLLPTITRLRRQHWLVVVALVLMAYFTYHAINGSRGLIAWHQYEEDLEAAQQELAGLKADRLDLEQKVRRMRHDGLDADLLDEVARRTLSLADPQDVIILLDRQARLPD
jgi:cell division protein FtsB